MAARRGEKIENTEFGETNGEQAENLEEGELEDEARESKIRVSNKWKDTSGGLVDICSLKKIADNVAHESDDEFEEESEFF